MQSIIANLPALQIVIALACAPLCFILRVRGLPWLIAFIASLGTLAVSTLLFVQTSNGAVVSYAMGGWEPPYGIEFRVDRLNSLILLLVSSMAAITLVFARASVAREIRAAGQPIFYAAFLLCLAGLLGMAITGDAFNLFVFLEISSLSTYLLISYGNDRRALSASFQYLVLGTIGATMLLIGIGFLYMMTGTLNMADLAARLPAVMDTNTVRAAFAFIVIGLSIKIALAPLHIWLPGAYGYAPSVISIFLAATATKVALYALIRFVFTIFGVDFAFAEMPLQPILVTLASLAVIGGSILAITQRSIKHLLAYSSVAQIGYMVLGIAMVSAAGVAAGVLHMVNHAIIKACLFMAVGCVFYRKGSVSLDAFQGLGKTMPWTMGAFVIGGLSLIGVPLTAGFVSKWYLILAALDRGMIGIFIVAVILVGSLLSIAYVWRVVEAAYFTEPETAGRNEAPMALLVPTWALALATIWFGLQTSFTVNAAADAAQAVMGGG